MLFPLSKGMQEPSRSEPRPILCVLLMYEYHGHGCCLAIQQSVPRNIPLGRVPFGYRIRVI